MTKNNQYKNLIDSSKVFDSSEIFESRLGGGGGGVDLVYANLKTKN